MRRKTTWMLMIGVSIVGATTYIGSVLATPATGFVGTTLAVGRFSNIDVVNHELIELANKSRHRKNFWLSWQKTKGPSDLYIQNNVWAPGGSTGWHTHPGHSLIIVTAGTLTGYRGRRSVVHTAGIHGRDGIRRSRRRPRPQFAQ